MPFNVNFDQVCALGVSKKLAGFNNRDLNLSSVFKPRCTAVRLVDAEGRCSVSI